MDVPKHSLPDSCSFLFSTACEVVLVQALSHLEALYGKKLAMGPYYTGGQACQKQLAQSRFHASLGRLLLHYKRVIPLRMPCIHEVKASVGEPHASALVFT